MTLKFLIDLLSDHPQAVHGADHILVQYVAAESPSSVTAQSHIPPRWPVAVGHAMRVAAWMPFPLPARRSRSACSTTLGRIR
jgi:hypothetical protein